MNESIAKEQSVSRKTLPSLTGSDKTAAESMKVVTDTHTHRHRKIRSLTDDWFIKLFVITWWHFHFSSTAAPKLNFNFVIVGCKSFSMSAASTSPLSTLPVTISDRCFRWVVSPGRWDWESHSDGIALVCFLVCFFLYHLMLGEILSTKLWHFDQYLSCPTENEVI